MLYIMNNISLSSTERAIQSASMLVPHGSLHAIGCEFFEEKRLSIKEQGESKKQDDDKKPIHD